MARARCYYYQHCYLLSALYRLLLLFWPLFPSQTSPWPPFKGASSYRAPFRGSSQSLWVYMTEQEVLAVVCVVLLCLYPVVPRVVVARTCHASIILAQCVLCVYVLACWTHVRLHDCHDGKVRFPAGFWLFCSPCE